MRIISGKAKGKRLYSPKGRGIRPTADQVKESIFNILVDQWEGMRVLDLFSGTGSLGLEAISRGAHQAVFVERSSSAVKLLKENISLCGFGSCAVVLAMPVPQALSLMGQRREPFQVIFADPPYGKGLVEKTVREILRYGVLSQDGIIVMEHAVHEPPCKDHGNLVMLRQKTYGQTTISFLGFEVPGKQRGIGHPREWGEYPRAQPLGSSSSSRGGMEAGSHRLFFLMLITADD